MTSIEQSLKSQFAKVFTVADWPLFKKLAESNLYEAATLKTSDMPIEKGLRLLARNSRKRLLIGVGVELLLKAVYLKRGYLINRPARGSSLNFPFSAENAAGVQLLNDRTFTLNYLIEHLPKVLPLSEQPITIRGLSIAKVFRNKEGHVVTAEHAFDAANYQDIAAALMALYRDAFSQILSVQFSLASNERAVWTVSRSKPSMERAISDKSVSALQIQRRTL